MLYMHIKSFLLKHTSGHYIWPILEHFVQSSENQDFQVLKDFSWRTTGIKEIYLCMFDIIPIQFSVSLKYFTENSKVTEEEKKRNQRKGL